MQTKKETRAQVLVEPLSLKAATKYRIQQDFSAVSYRIEKLDTDYSLGKITPDKYEYITELHNEELVSLQKELALLEKKEDDGIPAVARIAVLYSFPLRQRLRAAEYRFDPCFQPRPAWWKLLPLTKPGVLMELNSLQKLADAEGFPISWDQAAVDKAVAGLDDGLPF